VAGERVDRYHDQSVNRERKRIVDAEKLVPVGFREYREIPSYGDKKLRIMAKYLYAYSTIVSKYFRRFWYLETGAGPGVCMIRRSSRHVLGTPFLALTNKPSFTDFRLIEHKPELADALRERIGAYLPRLDAKKIVRTGDCNVLFGGILDEIPVYDPFLLFMDSEGLETKWHTVIVPACQRKHVDLLINFPYDDAIHRNLWRLEQPGSNFEQEVNEFMPPGDWRTCVDDNYSSDSVCNDVLREGFIDLYESGLRGLGMNYIVTSPPIKNRRNTPVYSFIFASKNRVAGKIMGEIISKPESSVQSTLSV